MSASNDVLLERAMSLVSNEWGKTREEVLAWLNDEHQWAEDPPTFRQASSQPVSGGFVMHSRITTVPADYDYDKVLKSLLDDAPPPQATD